MNKAEIERTVQLARLAQGKSTKRKPEQILNAERAVAAGTLRSSTYTGSEGKLTSPDVL